MVESATGKVIRIIKVYGKLLMLPMFSIETLLRHLIGLVLIELIALLFLLEFIRPVRTNWNFQMCFPGSAHQTWDRRWSFAQTKQCRRNIERNRADLGSWIISISVFLQFFVSSALALPNSNMLAAPKIPQIIQRDENCIWWCQQRVVLVL